MSGNVTTRTTKRLHELPAGVRVQWQTKTYVILGPSTEDEERIFLYAPTGKIARWPKDQLIADVSGSWVVYDPTVWDQAPDELTTRS